MFRPQDIKQLNERGISPQQAEDQMKRFTQGFPYLNIKGAAVPGDGITVLTDAQEDAAEQRWAEYLADGGEVCKFVPASGAASRMFKALFEFAGGDTDVAAPGSDVAKLLERIHELPFAEALSQKLVTLHGMNLDAMLQAQRNRDIIAAIVGKDDLNYGQLPKAVLLFHSYADGPRMPLDEQLTEGAQTAANSKGVVNLHFTVSTAHRALFEDTLKTAIPNAEKRTGVKYNVSLSEQKPSTDTLAANPDKTPFIDADTDTMLFRPGGHGALIENLNDIGSAVVFIKNIDNVVPDNRRDSTVRYKRVIGGTLMLVHDRIVKYLDALKASPADEALLAEVVDFMEHTLCTTDARFQTLKGEELAALLVAKLNRPLRVAGMVRNEGEPGGGPYIAQNPDGSWSPQVLESTQIDTSNPEAKAMMQGATHFNPVDLVCYIQDAEGRKFDLRKYVDPATGFISHKSAKGRELLAMELPGLWNGAMSDWNTVFVEVPVSTFNPVKTVNDLLRPAHLG